MEILKSESMHRIVHLDLKGAPPKVSYLEKVFYRLRTWGATGVLLEWEDTFPYSGDLMEIGSSSNAGGDNMYTLAETQHILQLIKYHGLDPIQLVQVMGHMEFVLKYPIFRELREIQTSVSALCPSNPKSQELIREMINQTLDAQPDAKYFHIGADEVWFMGLCAKCQERTAAKENKTHWLYLEHIKDIVLYIKQKRPDITVLMWDDMLRTIPLQMLQDYKIGELVIPVLWSYQIRTEFAIKEEIINNYSQVFPVLMFGSAFKGANGSCRILSRVARYTSNQKAWLAFTRTHAGRLKFCGGILTGWSRYDHYATLCELLPAALPSVKMCLKIWVDEDGMNIKDDDPKYEVLHPTEWPGMIMAECVRACMVVEERSQKLLAGDTVKTWLNPWQISRKYTSTTHVEGILADAENLLTQLALVKTKGHEILLDITGERSADEWITTYVSPWITKVSRLRQLARERARTGPSVRPLIIE